MKRFKIALFKLVHKIGHKGEHIFHMAYLGMVGWEGHGNYRYAAIGLLVMVILNMFASEE